MFVSVWLMVCAVLRVCACVYIYMCMCMYADVCICMCLQADVHVECVRGCCMRKHLWLTELQALSYGSW